eukprot:scaffold662351_cov51-Prasinocladus_malaysianus.AAC.3
MKLVTDVVAMLPLQPLNTFNFYDDQGTSGITTRLCKMILFIANCLFKAGHKRLVLPSKEYCVRRLDGMET